MSIGQCIGYFLTILGYNYWSNVQDTFLLSLDIIIGHMYRILVIILGYNYWSSVRVTKIFHSRQFLACVCKVTFNWGWCLTPPSLAMVIGQVCRRRPPPPLKMIAKKLYSKSNPRAMGKVNLSCTILYISQCYVGLCRLEIAHLKVILVYCIVRI